MTETRNLQPPLMPMIARDEVIFSAVDGKKSIPLKVVIHYFVFDGDGWKEIAEEITLPSLTRPLKDFIYRKPIENPSNPWTNPLEIRPDNTARIGYFAISLGKIGRRPPNHLFEDCEFLITLTNFGTEEAPDWQTRYFPRAYLPNTTWEEALMNLQI